MDEETRVLKICEILSISYPDPVTELVYSNEMQLFVSVVLSAQTTDKKVNEVTAALFKKYLSWEDFAKADLQILQRDIRGVNFHLGKAQRLIKAGQTILTQFGGKLPQTLTELIQIPGVARKSANVILKELWNKSEGIVVDTHVSRVSARLGLTTNTDPKKIELDLMKIIPKKYWLNISGSIVLLGRYICKARKPECSACPLNALCPSAFKIV